MARRKLPGEHPGCPYLASVIDGDNLAEAGIEGGDLLFCNKCGWVGRPPTTHQLVFNNIFEENDERTIDGD